MDVENTLREFGIQYTREPEKFRVKCPFHSDENPSATIHHKTGYFTCWVCHKKASLVIYLTKFSNLPIYQVKSKLGIRSDCKYPVDPNLVNMHHEKIWEHPTFLAELKHRCITEEIIRKRRLGIYENGPMEKRISIPIINEVGEYVNLRLYIPGAAERKFLNLAGKDRSKIRLYPIEQIEYDTILIVGGEMKALAGAEVLNKYDIGCITATCGENTWPNELNHYFANKLIYVCLDLDETGDTYSEVRCRILKPVAREIHKVRLPEEFLKGVSKPDINDFLRLGGDLYQLLLDSPEWKLIPGGQLSEDVPISVEFREAFSPSNVGKKVEFTGIVSAIQDSTSWFAPSLVQVSCSRDQEYCTICDVNTQAFLSDGTGTQMSIGKEHPAILSIVGENDDNLTKVYKKCFRIPQKCRVCTFERKSEYAVREVRLDEQVEPTSRKEPLVMKVGFIVDGPENLDASQSYNISGRLYPSPKNQVASFLISKCELTNDALDSYEPPDSRYFEIFTPDEWTVDGIQKKLDEIYDDLEANVTKIWQRRDYHLAIDLTYHSILHFDFGESKSLKGWVECLIIGDTGQGKSEAMNQLMKYYGLGVKVDCKNVTLPGLTIGLEKSNNKHFAVYGHMPKNDRKLLVFEELKGMRPEVFQSLTEVRSSGLVQISKIEHKTRRARTRIIAISNPLDGREVASYTYGIESAVAVIGTHEDLRRFDFVMILGRNDINQEELTNTIRQPPKVENRFTDDQCQKLILKAWKCEVIVFEDLDHVITVTKRLLERFGDGPPVLDSNSSHIKVAKLSAALAARTNSYVEEKLVVRKCHIDYIEQFLCRIYSSPSSKLDDKCRSVRESNLLRDKEGLVKHLKSLNAAADVVLKLAETDVITCRFVQELCGDMYIGYSLFSMLIRTNAIQRIKGERYNKTAEFTKLLKTVEFEIKKPDYIQKGDF